MPHRHPPEFRRKVLDLLALSRCRSSVSMSRQTWDAILGRLLRRPDE